MPANDWVRAHISSYHLYSLLNPYVNCNGRVIKRVLTEAGKEIMKNDKVTVLLIDDDDVEELIIRRCFRKCRLSNPIVRVPSGRAALRLLHKGLVPPPFIILLDMNIPEMDGCEFLKIIRTDDKLKNTIVFMLTASANNSEVEFCYGMNVAGYFVKHEMDARACALAEFLKLYMELNRFPSHFH